MKSLSILMIVFCCVLMVMCSPGRKKIGSEQIERQVSESTETSVEREQSKQEIDEILNKRQSKIFTIPASMASRKFYSENLQDFATEADSDGDGLSDMEEIELGTNTMHIDTDGDGLADSWEVGLINDLDLKLWGASPLHKDIFVEMDYMVRSDASNGLGPDSNVLIGISNAFKNSPVSNPDGQRGINIHLVIGNEIAYDPDLNPLFQEFGQIKLANFNSRKAPVFHYMIWANAYNNSKSSGYSMSIPHSDFVVTLGTWHDGKGGNNEEKIGTFIHELGHNMGLFHGGNEDAPYKPNHLSVMNYLYQFSGIKNMHQGRFQSTFTYQPFTLPALNELNIKESDGLGKMRTLTGYRVWFWGKNGKIIEKPAEFEIDWNSNNLIDKNPINRDLNRDGYKTTLMATPNEWDQLNFCGGTIGDNDSVQILVQKSINQFKSMKFIELTEDMAKKLESLKEN